MISPFTGGHATRKVRKATLTFRGESYTIDRMYYECDVTKEHFVDEECDTKALNDLHEMYCRKHNIPTAQELRDLRMRYGLSAKAMARIAGIGINRYSLYEKGEIPTLSIGRTLANLQEPDKLLEYVDDAKDKLGKDYKKVRSIIESRKPLVYRITDQVYNRFVESLCGSTLVKIRPQKKNVWNTTTI